MSQHRFLTRMVGLAAVATLAFAACSTTGTSTAPSAAAPSAAPSAAAPSAAASGGAVAGPSQALIDAAKAEGNLTTIALPHDWCNYGEVLSSFTAKYGIKINELNPLGSSGDEIEAIKANQNNPGPQAPDVVDVGFSFGEDNKDLFEPYKVATWDTIPDSAKSADGIWYGDYYGVMAFATNTSIQADAARGLEGPAQSQVQGPDRPRRRSAHLEPGHPGRLCGGPGQRRLAGQRPAGPRLLQAGRAGRQLRAGRREPRRPSPRARRPIALRWSYNGLSHRDSTAGNPTIDVTVPASGRFGGVYVQAISKYAPHPNAAKLWMEHLYSDEGQLLWLKGYCNPIRYEDLVARNVVPADLAAKLPDTTGAVFPTPAQLKAATDLITKGWDATVGVDVVAPPA